MDLDNTLIALADPTRRAILERLSQGEALVTELPQISVGPNVQHPPDRNVIGIEVVLVTICQEIEGTE